MSEKRKRARYTAEFKVEAVRLVKGGQSTSVTSKVLGIPNATLDNWVKLSATGPLIGVNAKPVSQEQMELRRLKARLSRVTMERNILKLANRYFARESL
jgi:transposase-like protein